MVYVCPNVEALECEGKMAMTREKDSRYAEMLVEAAANLRKVKEGSVKTAHLTPSFISSKSDCQHYVKSDVVQG